jgi:hypothetical protein
LEKFEDNLKRIVTDFDATLLESRHTCATDVTLNIAGNDDEECMLDVLSWGFKDRASVSAWKKVLEECYNILSTPRAQDMEFDFQPMKLVKDWMIANVSPDIAEYDFITNPGSNHATDGVLVAEFVPQSLPIQNTPSIREREGVSSNFIPPTGTVTDCITPEAVRSIEPNLLRCNVAKTPVEDPCEDCLITDHCRFVLRSQ